ncbi:MAG: thiosulfate sulfurtransferase [Candidatus Omnitrophica bacterium]|nr:thiosulfate sulfurtransferase [Candidatus Omnitrophota bacterium]
MIPDQDNIKELSVEEARLKISAGEAIVIDVRAALDHETESIAGARHIASQEDFDEFITQADKERTVICYCYYGNSSLGVCAALQERGFTNAYSLRGGFDAWKNADG